MGQSLLFTINDLLDLAKLESGQHTSFNEPFDLHRVIEDGTQIYRSEARRRNLKFVLEVSGPRLVVGDSRKIRTVIANLTANAREPPTVCPPLSVSASNPPYPSEILNSGKNHSRV